MYVCVCNAVTSDAIRLLVADNNLSSIEELQAYIAVANDCKKCVQTINELLDSTPIV